jgi:hypothetical protein
VSPGCEWACSEFGCTHGGPAEGGAVTTFGEFFGALETPFLHWDLEHGSQILYYRWSTQTALQAIGTGWIVAGWPWWGWYAEPPGWSNWNALGYADQGARLGFGAR